MCLEKIKQDDDDEREQKPTKKKYMEKNYEMGYPKSFNFGFTLILTWSFRFFFFIKLEIFRYYGYDMWV